MFACIHAASQTAALLDCAQAFSPQVEQTAADTVVLDASGLGHVFGTAHDLAHAIARRAAAAGIQAHIAIASNPDAAVHAARGFSGVSIIPHGDEAKYLASLPVHLLSAPPEIEETLARWGIRTFRDLAGLPQTGVSARLGAEGVRLQKLARGEYERPLVPVEAPLRFEEETELEYPLALLEPLLFVLARLLTQLCARLEARALATNELRLRLKLEDRSEHERALRLPAPMRNSRTFLKLLQLDLSDHPPAAPIVKVWIAAEPAKPRVTQNGLFIPLAPEPEKLELTLARLAAVVGEDHVGSPELIATHRPGAFRMRRFAVTRQATGRNACPTFLALRAFRPPKNAQVQAPSGRPAYLSAPGISGAVLSLAGPWRSAGDWWTPDAWARDEWDVALSDGALYRIFCDGQTGRWFVEGRYD